MTDPQAAWVTRKGIDPFFAYDANYLIDNKVGIILDAEGTRANRIEEIAIAQSMVDRVERRFKLADQISDLQERKAMHELALCWLRLLERAHENRQLAARRDHAAA